MGEVKKVLTEVAWREVRGVWRQEAQRHPKLHLIGRLMVKECEGCGMMVIYTYISSPLVPCTCTMYYWSMSAGSGHAVQIPEQPALLLDCWAVGSFATDILSTIRHSRGKVHKVMNIKDVFLEC